MVCCSLPRLFTVVALLLALPLTLQAQTSFAPSNNGIDRVLVYDLIRNSTGDLLLATPAGIFREGSSSGWQLTDVVNSAHTLYQLESGTLLAGTARGILRSSDGGATWQTMFNVPGAGSFSQREDGRIISIDRSSNNTRDAFYYFSEDDGVNWEAGRLGFSVLADTDIASLGNLFFIGSSSGLKLSFNGGVVWETTRLRDTVTSLISTESGVLVAAAGNIALRSRLYESYDSGTSWSLVDSIPGIAALEPGSDGEYFVVVSGIFPFDAEESVGVWRREVMSMERRRIFNQGGITSINRDEDGLALGANYRVFERSGGDDWNDRTAGITAVTIDRVVASSDGTMYALVPDSVRYTSAQHFPTCALFRSEDNGTSWEALSNGLSVDVLRVDSYGNLYGCTDLVRLADSPDGMFFYAGRRYRTQVSGDQGESWSDLGEGLLHDIDAAGNGSVAMILEDSAAQTRLSDLLYSLDSGETWARLSDPGNPWENVEDRAPPLTSEVAADGSIVFSISTKGREGIYLIEFDDDVPTVSLVDGPAHSPDIELLDNNTLIAATEISGSSLRISRDNGLTWEAYAPGQRIQEITPLGEGVLWGYRRFYSRNYGETWNTGPTQNQVIRAANGILYGTTGFNYRRSLNGGLLWLDSPFNNPPPTLALVANSNGYLFLGTSGSGIYRSTGPLSSVPVNIDREETSGLLLDLSLEGNRLLIEGESRDHTFNQAKLFTMNGLKVSTGGLSELGDGRFNGALTTGDLAAGSYLLLLADPQGMVVSRIVMIW